MMLGLLLARAGIETLVLEKHADFLRDFRGDTLHPSTLEVVAELGLLERLLENLGAPIDVLWFRLSRQLEDPQSSIGRSAGSASTLRSRTPSPPGTC